MLTEEKMQEMANTLAARIASRLGRAPLAPAAESRPRLILPASARAPDSLDEHTRARHERRISFIVGRYGLQWMVDQHSDCSVQQMDDATLLLLLSKCERALKAVQEGVSFDDAGLVQWAD